MTLGTTLPEALATFATCEEDALDIFADRQQSRGRRSGEMVYSRPVMMIEVVKYLGVVW